MARENQGLQITLIVFILLTLVLGVFTFLFYKQAGEERLKTAAAEQAKQDADMRASQWQNECNRMKEIVGMATTDELAAIDEAFNQDMATYAADTFATSEHQYRRLLDDYYTAHKQLLANLAAEKDAHLATKAALDQALADKLAQNTAHDNLAKKAQADLLAEQQKFAQDRARNAQEKDNLLAQLRQVQSDSDAQIAEKDQLVKTTEKENDQLTSVNDLLKRKMDDMTKPSFEVPDGKIRWVNQHSHTVWIGLGRADGLQRQTTFSVYNPNTNDVTKEYAKGSIEVTQILGDHLAEARIMEDEMVNPIMQGDLIHTPVWAPGQLQRFALTDGLDIDGDEKSDLEFIRNLIASNGGVVDVYIDDEGKVTGQMTPETRYLIEGKQTTEATDPVRRDARTQIQNEAQRLGIATMSVAELLRRMGYKEAAPIVTYGAGANPDDFRAKPPAGVPQVSSGAVSDLYRGEETAKVSAGAVSDLFRKRTPPPHATGTAYEN